MFFMLFLGTTTWQTYLHPTDLIRTNGKTSQGFKRLHADFFFKSSKNLNVSMLFHKCIKSLQSQQNHLLFFHGLSDRNIIVWKIPFVNVSTVN